MIKELINMIGCLTINDLIYIYNKIPYDLLFDTTDIELLMLLQDTFIPLYIILSDNSHLNTNISINKGKVPLKYEILLDNFYFVTIKLQKIVINIYGFFKLDCINIILKTSQISNNIIYTKKKLFINSNINLILILILILILKNIFL